MERKKVAILLPWLKMGGTNKVALRFIRQLSEYCDVTLILSQETGELFDEVPKNVKVLIDHMRSFQDLFRDDLKHFSVRFLWRDFLYYFQIKTGRDSIDNYYYLVSRQSLVVNDRFDCAVSYHGQSPERLLNLLYRVKSRKKVAWIHGAIGFSENQLRRMNKYYQKLDHFFFVSSPTRDIFRKHISIPLDKTTVYYNPLDKDEILRQAELSVDCPYPEHVIKILTVGRLSEEKGQDMIPAIVKDLSSRGYEVCWYIIGDGDKKKDLEEIIRSNHVERQVKLLGTKINPYSYMKACDLYVQPSYSEGYSTTICEAGTLGKAIIGTKPSGGIRDQISDGVDGMIVDASVQAITEAIQELIDHPSLKKQFEQNILKKDFEGKGELKKFLKILE